MKDFNKRKVVREYSTEAIHHLADGGDAHTFCGVRTDWSGYVDLDFARKSESALWGEGAAICATCAWWGTRRCK